MEEDEIINTLVISSATKIWNVLRYRSVSVNVTGYVLHRAPNIEMRENVIIDGEVIRDNEYEKEDRIKSSVDNFALKQIPININTADVDTLMGLPEIGSKLAHKIISYREENGKYYSIEEIKKIRGLGKKIFNKIKHKITV